MKPRSEKALRRRLLKVYAQVDACDVLMFHLRRRNGGKVLSREIGKLHQALFSESNALNAALDKAVRR